MTSIRVLSLFLLASAFSCEDDCAPVENCLEQVLDEYDMAPYKGEEVGCKFFLSMFTFDGKQYFRRENHCADMISFYVDCDGNKICEDRDQACLAFEAAATYVGVVGIDLN